MGNVKKIGDEYYIEFFARGLLYQQKAGKDPREAERLLAEIEGKIHLGEMGTIVRDADMDVFLKTYIEHNQGLHFAKTWARYLSTVTHFSRFMKNEFPALDKVSEITPKVIERYRSHLIEELTAQTIVHERNRQRTINLTLYILRDILSYALTLGYINDDPTLHVRFFNIPLSSGIRKVLSEDTVKIIASLPKHLKNLSEFLIHTGLTVLELTRLKWENVDLNNRRISIETYGRSRTVPLDECAFEILNRLRIKNILADSCVFCDARGQPLHKETTCAELVQSIHHHSIANIDFTFFRLIFIKRMAKRGVDMIGLYKLLGLNDFVKMLRYEPLIREINTRIQ